MDEEAKWATQGNSSDVAELPEFLHSTLPDRVSTIWQAYKDTLLPQWQEQWRKSLRYMKMSHDNLTLPSDKYFKMVKLLPKAVTLLLTQLRTSHAPLNGHLHAILAVDSSHWTPETILYYLMDYPCYQSQRHQLRQELGHKANNLSYLLSSKSSKKAVPPLIKFVNATHQLRPTYGVIWMDTGD